MRRVSQLIGALILSAILPAYAGPALQAENAWVREGPPNAPVLAAFMTLHNTADKPAEIVRVTSTRFARVEMHLSRMENGMARMIAQPSLTVPASGALELTPGGYHLMLFDPDRPVQAGQRVTFMLHTRDGREVSVDADVRKAMGGMHHHGH